LTAQYKEECETENITESCQKYQDSLAAEVPLEEEKNIAQEALNQAKKDFIELKKSQIDS